MMVSLNVGGRCAVVVPDGMLVNNSLLHNGTRKYLLDHFELKKIIKMRGKFFMNTSIKPSILFFENTGKPTEAVEFWDVIKNANGSVKETMILSVPRASLDETCSLDLRRFQEVKEVANPAGFPMVTLSNQCSMAIGGTPLRNRTDYYENGHHVWVSVSELNNCIIMDSKEHINDEGVKNSNVKLVKKGSILMSFKMSIGKCAIAGVDLYTNEAIVAFYSHDESILSNQYLFYYLSLRDLSHAGKGSIGAGSMNKESLSELTIPLPPLAIQQEIVATLDRIYAPGTTELADTLKLTSQAMDLVLAQPSGATLEPIVEAQRLMRKSAQMVADVKAQMVAIVKASMAGSGCTAYVLSDLANDNPESITKADTFETINYVDLGSVKEGNISTIQTIPFEERPSRAQRKIRQGDIIWGGVRPLSRSYAFIDTVVENMIGSSGFVVIRNKDIHKVLSKYLYYALTTDDCVNYLNNHSTGSSYPAFNASTIMAYEVMIPSITVQMKTLARLDALQSQLTALESLQRQSEDNARFILESYLHTEGAQAESGNVSDDEKEEPRITSIARSTPIRRPRSVSPARSDAVATSEASVAPPNYESMSLAALKDLCKARGLRGLSGKKKEELVVILRDLS
jgi:type I restriction enzyme S subunit